MRVTSLENSPFYPENQEALPSIAKSEAITWKIDSQSLKSLELGIQNKIQFKVVQLMVKRLDDMNKKYIKVVQEKTSAKA